MREYRDGVRPTQVPGFKYTEERVVQHDIDSSRRRHLQDRSPRPERHVVLTQREE